MCIRDSVDLVDLQAQRRGEVLQLVALNVRRDTTAILVVVLEPLAVDEHFVRLGLADRDLLVGGFARLEEQDPQLSEEREVVSVRLGVHLTLERLESAALFGFATLLTLEFFLVAALDLAQLSELVGLDGLAFGVDLALLLRLGRGLLPSLSLMLVLFRRGLGLGFALLEGLRGGSGFGLGGGGLRLGVCLGPGFALLKGLGSGCEFGLRGGGLPRDDSTLRGRKDGWLLGRGLLNRRLLRGCLLRECLLRGCLPGWSLLGGSPLHGRLLRGRSLDGRLFCWRLLRGRLLD